MNQGRIWTVVNPTVGLPLFLGSVAVTSVLVHYAVLSNTPWMSSYWSGHAKAKTAAAEPAATTAPVALSGSDGVNISVAPVASKTAGEAASFVITVSPKVMAQADSRGETVALATPR